MTKQASPYANAQGAKTVTLSVQSWVGAQANVGRRRVPPRARARLPRRHRPGGRGARLGRAQPGPGRRHPGGLGPPGAGDSGTSRTRRPSRRAATSVSPATSAGTSRSTSPTQHPDVTDWKNLNKYAEQLRTAESGGKGQLLDGSPSYVTNDKALVKNLGPRLPGGVRRLRGGADHPDQAVRQGEEALPQLLVPAAVAVREGADDGGEAARVQGGLRRRTRTKIACAYPHTPLQKYLNADFAEHGGKAAEFLKNFNWTTGRPERGRPDDRRSKKLLAAGGGGEVGRRSTRTSGGPGCLNSARQPTSPSARQPVSPSARQPASPSARQPVGLAVIPRARTGTTRTRTSSARSSTWSATSGAC